MSTRGVVFAWLPSILYMGLIWVMSSLSTVDLDLDRVPLRDKGIHFVEFAVLAFLVAHASLRTWPNHAVARTLSVAVLITFAWGVLDELHQAFVPGRSADPWDLLADGLGAVAGATARLGARLVWRKGRASLVGSSRGPSNELTDLEEER